MRMRSIGQICARSVRIGRLLFVMAQQIRIQGRFGFSNVLLVKLEEYSLGNGSYGAVCRAKCDQLVCAAKVLHPIFFQTRDPAAYRIVECFPREIVFSCGVLFVQLITRKWPDPGPRMNFVQVNDPRFPSHLKVSGDMLYCVDGVSDTIVLTDWLLWTIVVSQCPSLLLLLFSCLDQTLQLLSGVCCW